MRCNAGELIKILQHHWKKLTRHELERTGLAKRKLALLIQRTYGIGRVLAENYLSNLERTLPLA
jgi:hypothetical protein